MPPCACTAAWTRSMVPRVPRRQRSPLLFQDPGRPGTTLVSAIAACPVWALAEPT